MSAVTSAEVLSHVATSKSVYDIQELIDEEEAWLARRIGPLVGERTEVFFAPSLYDILQLRRPTDSAEVIDNDVAVDAADIQMRANGWRITRTTGYWLGDLQVTYTPNDWLEVRRAVIDLVRSAIAISEQNASEGAYDAETIGEYSYRRAQGIRAPQATRLATLATLGPPRAPFSSKVLSSTAIDPQVTRPLSVL